MGHVIHYKVGQSCEMRQWWSNFTTTWGKYYKVAQSRAVHYTVLPFLPHILHGGLSASLLIWGLSSTAWKVSKYGVFSGPYFPAFGLNTERYDLSVFSTNAEKYGPEQTLHLDTFHTVQLVLITCSGFFLYLLTVAFP